MSLRIWALIAQGQFAEAQALIAESTAAGLLSQAQATRMLDRITLLNMRLGQVPASLQRVRDCPSQLRDYTLFQIKQMLERRDYTLATQAQLKLRQTHRAAGAPDGEGAMTKTTAPLSAEQLAARLHEARAAGAPGSPERLQLHKALVKDCPTSTPNLLELARQLQLVEEPDRDTSETLAEVEQLLEQAVTGSERSAPAVVELAYFLDTLRDAPELAAKLYEEGATRALDTLEDAWAGLLRAWVHERTHESLKKALRIGALAEELFPDSGRLQGAVHDARQAAARDGLLES